MSKDDNQTPTYPILTGVLVTDGQSYPIRGYSMLDHKHWPTYGGVYMASGIYPGNDGKVLVGQTSCQAGFKGRWFHYRQKLGLGTYPNPYLQSSVNKHGIANFVFWEIETDIPRPDLGKREWFWYDQLQSDKDKNGWNLQIPTKEGGRRLAPETRQKLSEINMGHTHTEETRAKMSKSRSGAGNCNWGKKGALNPLYGRKLSPERCEFLAEINRGEKSHRWGKTFSTEERRERSQNAARNVGCSLKSPTGEVLQFCNAPTAASACGVDRQQMSWFLKSSLSGDTINGWSFISYGGKRQAKAYTRSSRIVKLKNLFDGQIVEFTDRRAFAAQYRLNYNTLGHFLIKQKIGATFRGFEKIEPYQTLHA